MRSALVISLVFLSFQAFAQSQTGEMGGMCMPHPGSTNGPAIQMGSNAEAIESMEGRHVDMRPL